MRKSSVLLLGAVSLLLLAMPALGAGGGFNGNMDYTDGPNVCGECHTQAFDDWLAHGHSRKLALAFNYQGENMMNVGITGQTSNPRNGGFPLPRHMLDDPDNPYVWSDILGIIGASKYWKTRFIDLQGYIMTGNGGKNQYNWATGEWVNYHIDDPPGTKPFNCGTCHTTGYRLEGTAFQDGTGSIVELPGVVGDFSHINITCEACHGPGAAHAAAPAGDNIVGGDDITAASCGSCHTRPFGGDDNIVLASGGFIKHHEQYPEFLAGAHNENGFFDSVFGGCTGCHEGHIGRSEGWSAVTSCETCHGDEAAAYAGSSMELEGVKCIDCHMGRATKSARANGPWEGDVWTHLFRINTAADYDMFNRDEDNNTVSVKQDPDGALSLEFACFRCHADADKADYAAISMGGKGSYHTLGK